MELIEPRFHFEDFAVGATYRTAGRTITESDLVAFVNASGMTGELFTNVELARRVSVLDARPVPGLLPLLFCEALNAQGPIRGAGLALLALEVEFTSPARVGDTVHSEAEVIEARRSASRPGTGLVRFRHRIIRQDGEVLTTYTALRMIRARQDPGENDGTKPG